MPFPPEGFLSVARGLAKDGSGEAELRTAVGRAYYCAFLMCRGRVRDRLSEVRLRVSAHANVIALVRSRNTNVGNQLDRLRWLRVWADYCLSPLDYALFREQPPHLEWDRHWTEALALTDDILKTVHRL